jgi:hypothetical protein
MSSSIAVLPISYLLVGNDVLGGAVRNGGDGQAGVRAHRPRHDGSIGDVVVRVSVNLPVGVLYAFLFVSSHRTATERVHGDDPTQVSERVVAEGGDQTTRDRVRALAHMVEIRCRASETPVDVEQIVLRQQHVAIRNLSTHGEHRERRRGGRGRPDRRRDLRADVAVGVEPEPAARSRPDILDLLSLSTPLLTLRELLVSSTATSPSDLVVSHLSRS